MYMLDTLATFHLLMSALNVGLSLNKDAMLVTAAVFQSAIGPYVVVAVVGLVSHAVAAVSMFALVTAVCAATCAGRKSSSATPTRRCDRHARAHLHRKRGRRAAPPCDTVVFVASSCNEENQVATLRDAPHQFCKGRRNTENLPQTHRYCCAEYAGLHCELQRFRF
jgi:hypothetical protein